MSHGFELLGTGGQFWYAKYCFAGELILPGMLQKMLADEFIGVPFLVYRAWWIGSSTEAGPFLL